MLSISEAWKGETANQGVLISIDSALFKICFMLLDDFYVVGANEWVITFEYLRSILLKVKHTFPDRETILDQFIKISLKIAIKCKENS